MENTNKETLQFENVKCPVCGNDTFVEFPGPKTIYGCSRLDSDGYRCRGIVCRCNKCEKVYPSTNFGKHIDVYECKTCGSVQWDYTDMKKTDDRISQAGNQLDALRNSILKNLFN